MQKAQQADFAPFDAHDWRIGLVVAQFNKQITGQLRDSAVKRAAAYHIDASAVDVFTVAGAIEIPLVLQQMAASKRYDALLAVGCVINGETPHFEYVCKFVSEGVLRVQLDHAISIGFGVLTCNDEAQAQARAHLGGEHLDAALQQARLLRSL